MAFLDATHHSAPREGRGLKSPASWTREQATLAVVTFCFAFWGVRVAAYMAL